MVCSVRSLYRCHLSIKEARFVYIIMERLQDMRLQSTPDGIASILHGERLSICLQSS